MWAAAGGRKYNAEMKRDENQIPSCALSEERHGTE